MENAVTDKNINAVSPYYPNNILTFLAKCCLRILGLCMTEKSIKTNENITKLGGNNNNYYYVDIERQETSFAAPGSLEQRLDHENERLLIQMGAISTNGANKNTGCGCCKRSCK